MNLWGVVAANPVAVAPADVPALGDVAISMQQQLQLQHPHLHLQHYRSSPVASVAAAAAAWLQERRRLEQCW